MDIEGSLAQIGLSKNQIKVYLALLQLGQGTIQEITLKSKTIYLGWPGAAPGPSQAPTGLHEAEASSSGIAQHAWPLRPVRRK